MLHNVLLYSDCLIESLRPDGTQLQHEGLLEVLNGLNAGETLDREESILEALLTAIAARGHALDDDMTAVILRCTERSAGAAPVRMAAGLARSFLKLFTRDGPWPEWSKANILGPWIHRFQRR